MAVETVGVYQAKTHLAQLLQRVGQGESVTITKHGRPVARLVPVLEDRRERAQRAADGIRDLRRRVGRASVEELIATIHEGHRY